MMGRLIVGALGLLAISSPAAMACMRPEMDERAVQWSSAIVEARLESIGSKVQIGQVDERRGALGALGTTATSYYYRVYEFNVAESFDGHLKAGGKMPVVRIFSRTETIGGVCSQHLAQDAVGKSFILLVRPLSDFPVVVPSGVKPPDVTGGMWVVHLEPKAPLKPDAIADLKTMIASVRAAEAHATPQSIDRLVSQIVDAESDARAGPSVRALERFGPQVIPAAQKAMGTAHPAGRARLLQVVNDLTPLAPIFMISPDPDQAPPRR